MAVFIEFRFLRRIFVAAQALAQPKRHDGHRQQQHDDEDGHDDELYAIGRLQTGEIEQIRTASRNVDLIRPFPLFGNVPIVPEIRTVRIVLKNPN